jgi:hypothetical protein
MTNIQILNYLSHKNQGTDLAAEASAEAVQEEVGN